MGPVGSHDSQACIFLISGVTVVGGNVANNSNSWRGGERVHTVGTASSYAHQRPGDNTEESMRDPEVDS